MEESRILAYKIVNVEIQMSNIKVERGKLTEARSNES